MATQVLKLTGQLRMETETTARAQSQVQTGNVTVISTSPIFGFPYVHIGNEQSFSRGVQRYFKPEPRQLLAKCLHLPASSSFID